MKIKAIETVVLRNYFFLGIKQSFYLHFLHSNAPLVSFSKAILWWGRSLYSILKARKLDAYSPKIIWMLRGSERAAGRPSLYWVLCWILCLDSDCTGIPQRSGQSCGCLLISFPLLLHHKKLILQEQPCKTLRLFLPTFLSCESAAFMSATD